MKSREREGYVKPLSSFALIDSKPLRWCLDYVAQHCSCFCLKKVQEYPFALLTQKKQQIGAMKGKNL